MSNIFDEILRANSIYAENFGSKKNLSMPPARKTAILMCHHHPGPPPLPHPDL
jgi:hypothetical protein